MTSISTGEYRKAERNIDIIMSRNSEATAKMIAEKERYFKYMFEQIVEHTREESE